MVNSSLYEKSSWYNRKRASRACLPQKVGALLGCSGKAVSGNIVKCHVGGVYTLSLTLIFSHTFEGVEVRGGCQHILKWEYSIKVYI